MLVYRKQMDLYEKQTKEKNREGDSRDKSGRRRKSREEVLVEEGYPKDLNSVC